MQRLTEFIGTMLGIIPLSIESSLSVNGLLPLDFLVGNVNPFSP